MCSYTCTLPEDRVQLCIHMYVVYGHVAHICVQLCFLNIHICIYVGIGMHVFAVAQIMAQDLHMTSSGLLTNHACCLLYHTLLLLSCSVAHQAVICCSLLALCVLSCG